MRGRNRCVPYVCVARCSNVTIIRNISSNIPTKLTEFINRNCTQDAVKRINSLSEPNIFSGKIPRTPFTRGGNPHSCSPRLVPSALGEGFRRPMAGSLFKSRRRSWAWIDCESRLKGNDQEPIQSNSTSRPKHQTVQAQPRRHLKLE